MRTAIIPSLMLFKDLTLQNHFAAYCCSCSWGCLEIDSPFLNIKIRCVRYQNTYSFSLRNASCTLENGSARFMRML